MATSRVSILLDGWKTSLLLSLALIGGQGAAQIKVPEAAAAEVTIESVFAEAPFAKWQAEGPKQQIPWKVHMSADRLSFHQRLIANIQVEVPGPELVKRSHDQQILLLVQVTNGLGVSFRNYGLLELDKMKPELKRSDVQFSWQAFAVPGQYDVSVALWDKTSGEHSFLRRLFHVDAYKNDPLPSMWRGLDAFEFWSTSRDGPEFIFHSDIDGHLHLPVLSKRPILLEVLLDVTPSAEIFHGNYAIYNHYLAQAVPTFKTFSQITLENGSLDVAALDLAQHRIVFEQSSVKDIDWPSLRKAISPDNGPGVVSVNNLKNRQQSPVFLREEIVRRLSAQRQTSAPAPLHVFVVIGPPMDLYLFRALPEIETGNEADCLIYYLELGYLEFDPMHGRAIPGSSNLGSSNHLETMLKPLKVHTIQVYSPDDARHALAKILDEVGKK